MKKAYVIPVVSNGTLLSVAAVSRLLQMYLPGVVKEFRLLFSGMAVFGVM